MNRHPGILSALAAALLFGASTPLAKLALSNANPLLVAGLLMLAGVWLHVTEKHEHGHVHEPLEHEHLHFHDEHHQHEHGPEDPPGEPHARRHKHARLKHFHSHYPDIHHRHGH